MDKIGRPVTPIMAGDKTYTPIVNEILSGAFLDRSAHSLINRLVIRS
jgi:hypothetical protein